MTDPAAPLVMHPALGGPGIYVTSDDALRLTTLNSVASVTIALTGRFLTPDGRRVQPFQERHVPNSDRTAATSDFPLADGWLANLSAIVTGAAPQFGQTFVRVDLIRGRGTAAVVLATLLQGFVTSAQRLARGVRADTRLSIFFSKPGWKTDAGGEGVGRASRRLRRSVEPVRVVPRRRTEDRSRRACPTRKPRP